MSWKTPNIRKLIEALKKLRSEATMAANAGAYERPLGTASSDAGLQKGYEELGRRKKRKK